MIVIRRLPWACLVVAAAHAAAQTVPTATPDSVQIIGSAIPDDGRDSTASRVVVSRADIARFGDSSVTDVLRRVPGITVVGTPGRGSEVRMRGLGSGYTQLLINGDAAPAGFSLDSLSPGQIERIEVLRVATVDTSAQAIAGTINIILRQTTRKPEREVKATAGTRAGSPSYLLEGQFSDRVDGLSYSLGVGLSRKRDAWPSTITQEGSDAAGSPVSYRVTQRHAFGLARSASLTPKSTWKLGESDTLGIEALLRHTRFDDHSDNLRDVVLGPLPRYSSDSLRLDLRTTLAQGQANWQHTFGGGATVDTRLGLNGLRRKARSVFLGEDERRTLAMDERVDSATTENGVTAAGKFRLPYTQGHAVALGWDGERTRRDEARSQRQASPIGRPEANLDERFQSQVKRLAIYAQDEWDVQDALSVYAGLRWAALTTRTEGDNFTPVGNRSSVVSPVVQLLWKPAGDQGDQVRFAVSRSYKTPRTADLSPRRFVSIDNTATTPNLQGNPDLRPELAWGVDWGYEHGLAADAGSLNVGGSVRRIQDVILDRLSFDNGAWVSTKANQGMARVFSLEVESRWRPRAVWPSAPDMDLRAGVSRNWSTVDAVPGPDNRLDSQVPLSINIGADWRLAALPLTAGGSLVRRGSARTRSSLTQSDTANALNTLDLYAVWKFSPAIRLRAAVLNVLRPTEVSTDNYFDAGGRLRQTTQTPADATYQLGVEFKL